MSADDREIFYFDVRDIEWKSYFETFVLGARRFILKDDLSTLPLARSNLQRYGYPNLFVFFFCKAQSNLLYFCFVISGFI